MILGRFGRKVHALFHSTNLQELLRPTSESLALGIRTLTPPHPFSLFVRKSVIKIKQPHEGHGPPYA